MSTSLQKREFLPRKTIKNGKVGVIYSTGENGSGWYTTHGIFHLIFDSELIDMISKPYNQDVVLNYCQRKYGIDNDFSGIRNLSIEWIPEGSMFFFHTNDGKELVITWDQVREVSIQA